MRESKILTIALLITMLVYFLLSQVWLVSFGNIYTYIINPLFFMIVALLLKVLFLPPYKTNKFRKDIIQYVFITMLLYTFLYLLSGLLTGYGVNPYSATIKGIIFNLYSTGLVIFFREYIRWKLINNVFKKDRKFICFFIIAVFTIQDINIVSLITDISVYSLFKSIFYVLIPSIIKNSLFTFIEIYTDYKPAVIYELLSCMLLWLPPILPKSPWILEAIIDSIFPLILLLYCRYFIYSKSKFHLTAVERPIEPTGIIPLGICLVIVIWFALGIFPIKPVGIATRSMYPEIDAGDLVLVKECQVEELEEDDIIQYKRDSYTVIHRINKIERKDGEYIFTTKGDNNQSEDMEPVREEQVVGKVIFKIKYIAWPTIWINNLNNQEQIDIETGN